MLYVSFVHWEWKELRSAQRSCSPMILLWFGKRVRVEGMKLDVEVTEFVIITFMNCGSNVKLVR